MHRNVLMRKEVVIVILMMMMAVKLIVIFDRKTRFLHFKMMRLMLHFMIVLYAMKMYSLWQWWWWCLNWLWCLLFYEYAFKSPTDWSKQHKRDPFWAESTSWEALKQSDYHLSDDIVCLFKLLSNNVNHLMCSKDQRFHCCQISIEKGGTRTTFTLTFEYDNYCSWHTWTTTQKHFSVLWPQTIHFFRSLPYRQNKEAIQYRMLSLIDSLFLFSDSMPICHKSLFWFLMHS